MGSALSLKKKKRKVLVWQQEKNLPLPFGAFPARSPLPVPACCVCPQKPPFPLTVACLPSRSHWVSHSHSKQRSGCYVHLMSRVDTGQVYRCICILSRPSAPLAQKPSGLKTAQLPALCTPPRTTFPGLGNPHLARPAWLSG